MIHRTSQVQSALAATCFALVAACSSDSAVAPDGALTVYKIAGDRQFGVAGQQLSRALKVQVWSATRQVAGAAFSVEVTGGGSVDPATGHSDQIGRALMRWTLGETDGEQLLTVRIAGAEPRIFTATAVAVAPENFYSYRNESDEQRIIGLRNDGRFVAVGAVGCSGEGRYEISGPTISFVVLTAEPSGCQPLPELTGSIEDAAIVFEVENNDDWDYATTEWYTYWRSAP